jgi:hypothetical protein
MYSYTVSSRNMYEGLLMQQAARIAFYLFYKLICLSKIIEFAYAKELNFFS